MEKVVYSLRKRLIVSKTSKTHIKDTTVLNSNVYDFTFYMNESYAKFMEHGFRTYDIMRKNSLLEFYA